MNVPALPRSEADLAEWSVYTDELLRAGDPLGELLAFDLSLSSTPTRAEVDELARRARDRCWRRGKTLEAGWTLGHIRVLKVSPSRRHMHAPEPFDPGALGNLVALFRKPEAAHLEELHLGGPLQPSRELEAVFGALPETCTKLSVYTSRHVGIESWRGLIPSQITTLAVPFLHAATIDRRVIEVAAVDNWSRDAILEALDRNPEARLHVDMHDVEHDRILPRSGPRLVQGSRTISLSSLSLIQDQWKHGVIGVRAQLARTPPQTWNLYVHGRDHLQVARGGSGASLVRRGETWTLRRDVRNEMTVAGHPLGPHEIVELQDGDVLTVDDAIATFSRGPDARS
ncbi:MAG TPA: hypothetical protein VGC41_24565 [Kofleriaceae bacterium]